MGSGRCWVSIGSYKYTTSTQNYFFGKETLLFVVLSSAESRSEYPSESSWVEDQESSEGNIVALVVVIEEEEALIGVLDFQAIEANQGSIDSKITIAFPDLVWVGGAILPTKEITELSKWKEISM